MKRSEWRKLARGLYEYEHLVPWLYSKPIIHDEIAWHCLRHQIIADNWPDDPFVGHPLNLQQLTAEVDSAAPARTVKYANVISRSEDRVEFRSCDRLTSAHDILEMTLLRILTVDAVRLFGHSGDDSKYRNLFLDACANGTIDLEIVVQQRSRLEAAWNRFDSMFVPNQWKEYSETLFERMEAFAELDATKA